MLASDYTISTALPFNVSNIPPPPEVQISWQHLPTPENHKLYHRDTDLHTFIVDRLLRLPSSFSQLSGSVIRRRWWSGGCLSLSIRYLLHHYLPEVPPGTSVSSHKPECDRQANWWLQIASRWKWERVIAAVNCQSVHCVPLLLTNDSLEIGSSIPVAPNRAETKLVTNLTETTAGRPMWQWCWSSHITHGKAAVLP